jgi:hypothetical protein
MHHTERICNTLASRSRWTPLPCMCLLKEASAPGRRMMYGIDPATRTGRTDPQQSQVRLCRVRAPASLAHRVVTPLGAPHFVSLQPEHGRPRLAAIASTIAPSPGTGRPGAPSGYTTRCTAHCQPTTRTGRPRLAAIASTIAPSPGTGRPGAPSGYTTRFTALCQWTITKASRTKR